MAPVAALIIALRPPTMLIVTAMVNDANRPTRGSTPAMIENEIASGIRARATTRPARTSVRSTFGDSQTGRSRRGSGRRRRARGTVTSGRSGWGGIDMYLVSGRAPGRCSRAQGIPPGAGPGVVRPGKAVSVGCWVRKTSAARTGRRHPTLT